MLRNSLARCNTRHLRIKRLVQFTFADLVYNNVLKNRAALLCRACGDPPICVAERYLTLRIRGYMSARSASLRKKKSSAVPLISQRSHVGNLRQTLQGKRGDSQEGGKPQVVYPLVRPRGVSAISLASQAAKCDFCFVQSAQSTTPSGGAAMPKACFSSNYSVSQPVPPAG